ncbi:hypothetical protein DCS_04623 [Drechmeria coniospora]|uniref:Uncharacterized protein n=1 Tax=Drechmeria coniospora TaxID=98403 RepID=A0A151GKS5_DRECN|nr:hypothetical protein DCS_04623 [Drechmeria coniospora]KYK57612.1 hypothetical protein DCS_04623 [Drechmeria coniospora]ODA79501.1 hypothetical protein RJ55_05094 [Drechmeria coniospora]
MKRPSRPTAMNPVNDLSTTHTTVSADAGQSRCNFESSFVNIAHSTGFAEWAARADAQNQQLGVSSWSRTERDRAMATSSDEKKHKSSAFAKLSQPKKRNDGELENLKAGPKLSCKGEESIDGDEEMDDVNAPDNFVAHYANYNSMDMELAILKRALMQRRRHS